MSDRTIVIHDMLHAYKAAVFAKDVDAYIALYDDNVRIFDMWQDWSCQGGAEWRASTEVWFNSLGNERVLVDTDEVNVHIADTLATLDGFIGFSAQSPEGAILRSLTSRLTWILELRNPGWKIVHQHTSAPIDFKTTKAIFSRGKDN
jgi:ketosteroid isomerase-like protein